MVPFGPHTGFMLLSYLRTAAVWHFHSIPGIVSQASSGAWDCGSLLPCVLTDRKRHKGCLLQMKMKCRILSL